MEGAWGHDYKLSFDFCNLTSPFFYNILQASLEVLDEETAQLWWAGKEMVRSKKLKDFVGRNEKTKIIAKLQKKGQGAPAREPVFSEQERKEMMAYAYRKQEELKVQ